MAECPTCKDMPDYPDGGRFCGECSGMGTIPLARPKKVLIVEEDFYGFDPIRSYEEVCSHCRGTRFCPYMK